MSCRSISRKFNKNLKLIIDKGKVKINGVTILAAGYVFKVLDEKDPLHADANLKLLKNCKILILNEGQKLVITRELLRLNQNPHSSKFIDIKSLQEL